MGDPETKNLGRIETLSDVTAISSGKNHSLFLLSDGIVYSCGSNTYGQLGRAVKGGQQSLGKIETPTGVVNISAGDNHNLFVLLDGTVCSCGRNTYGQLGREVVSGSATSTNLARVEGLFGVSGASAGGDHSFFIFTDGTVSTCGLNTKAQLGREAVEGTEATINLQRVEELSGVIDTTGGYAHSLFLLSGSKVYSCGTNTSGELGRVVATGSETFINLGRIEGLV